MDYIFLTDIVLTFFTTVADGDGNTKTTHKEIAIHYLKGWFLIDFFSSFPFMDFIQLFRGTMYTSEIKCTGEGIPANNFDIRFILRLLRIPKLIRIAQITKIGRKLD